MTTIKWIWPTSFIGYRVNGDVREWGFQLDLRTELTYYTYDWGTGFTLVVLGWGLEVVRMPGHTK